MTEMLVATVCGIEVWCGRYIMQLTLDDDIKVRIDIL